MGQIISWLSLFPLKNVYSFYCHQAPRSQMTLVDYLILMNNPGVDPWSYISSYLPLASTSLRHNILPLHYVPDLAASIPPHAQFFVHACLFLLVVSTPKA
jgi:hypothetical protein